MRENGKIIWLVGMGQQTEKESETECKGVYQPLYQKGSIDPVYKPHLSTPFINPIYRPLLNKVYKPLLLSLADLRGNPLKITHYIFALQRNDAEKISSKVTSMEMMKNLNLSKDSVRTALRFLLKNGLLERIDFKVGKFGWSKYKLKNSLYNELLEADQKGLIDPINLMGSNSSSYIYNNTTTTYRPLLKFDHIDISPLGNIGFSKKHLLQLKSKNNPEIIQESINHFAYGLKNNPKTQKYNDPLTVLMGVLRKGEQWIEPSYQSPHEIALDRLLEEKKTRQEKISSLENELIKTEFENWYEALTDAKKIELTKGMVSSSLPERLKKRTEKGYLFNYFKENICKK